MRDRCGDSSGNMFFVWKGNESLGWDVLQLTSGGEEAEDCAFVLRLCQWRLASILIGVRVWHYAKADSQEHIIHLSAVVL